MFLPWTILPPEIIRHYNLSPLKYNNKIYILIKKVMYGLKQSGKISHDKLSLILTNHQFFSSPLTPGLWKHNTRNTSFILCVDDLGVTYINNEEIQYLFFIFLFTRMIIIYQKVRQKLDHQDVSFSLH